MVALSHRLISLAAAAVLTSCAAGAVAPDFTLQDDYGKPWTLSAQRDAALLLTFGFTHCADTCPATIARLRRVVASLGTHATRVQVVFITVDPTRDTSAVLHRYLSHFGDREVRLVGLTGTLERIRSVEKAYHVWAQRVPGRSRTRGRYDVAHSAIIFVIDQHDRISEMRDADDTDASLTRAVRAIVT